MKKSLIALAVLAAAMGSASAQGPPSVAMSNAAANNGNDTGMGSITRIPDGDGITSVPINLGCFTKMAPVAVQGAPPDDVNPVSV